MEISIDGEVREIDIEGLTTFKDLMAHLQENVVQLPSVITRIFVNEEEIDEGQEIGLGEFPITDIAKLAIHTADKLDLAYEALEDAQEYLPALSTVLEGAASKIRGGDIHGGLQDASQALEIIGAFGEVLDGIRGAFRIDFSMVRIDDLNLLDKLNQLNKYAQETLEAVQKQDWTLFADLIEYELSPLLYEWMAVIPEIIKLLPEREREEG
jgi:hypothetical protein